MEDSFEEPTPNIVKKTATSGTLLIYDPNRQKLFLRIVVRRKNVVRNDKFQLGFNNRIKKFHARVVKHKLVLYFNNCTLEKTSWQKTLIPVSKIYFNNEIKRAISEYNKPLKSPTSVIVVFGKKHAYSARCCSVTDWSQILPKSIVFKTGRLQEIFNYQGTVYDPVFFRHCSKELLRLSVKQTVKRIDTTGASKIKTLIKPNYFIYGGFDMETYGGRYNDVDLLNKASVQPTMMSWTLFLKENNSVLLNYLTRLFDYYYEQLEEAQKEHKLFYTKSVELLTSEDCEEAHEYAKYSFSVHAWDKVVECKQTLLTDVLSIIIDGITYVEMDTPIQFVVYGWNSAKFDSIMAFWPIQRKIFQSNINGIKTNCCLHKGPRLINFEVQILQHKLTFRDLMMIIPTIDGGKSLANFCETLKIKCSKRDVYLGNVGQLFADQKFIIDNINNEEVNDEVWTTIKKLEYYCAYDVFAVCELQKWFLNFFKTSFAAFGVMYVEQNIIECFSLPQIAIQTLWAIISNKLEIIEVAASLDTDWFLRQAIYGGRCMTNSYGMKFMDPHRCRRMSDFTSMYPSCLLNPYPVGALTYVNNLDILQSAFDDGSFYFMNFAPFTAHVQAWKHRKEHWTNEYPISPFRSTEGLIWIPDGYIMHHFATCVDLYLLLKDGWHIKLVEVIQWERWERVCREAFLKFFNRRLQAKQENDEEISYFCKILMNMSFGKTIQKPVDNGFKADSRISQVVQQEDLSNQFISVQIGSFVLSYSRLLWHSFVDWSFSLTFPSGKIPRLLYTDTDSFLMEYWTEEDANWHFNRKSIHTNLTDLIAENGSLQMEFGIVFENKCKKSCPRKSTNIPELYIGGKKLYCMHCPDCAKQTVKGKGLNLNDMNVDTFVNLIENPSNPIVNSRKGCLKVTSFKKGAVIMNEYNSMCITGYDLNRRIVLRHPDYQKLETVKYYEQEIQVYKCYGKVVNAIFESIEDFDEHFLLAANESELYNEYGRPNFSTNSG